MIKFLSMQNYKSGVRVTLSVEKERLENYGKKHKSVMKISHLLSSKPEEVTEAGGEAERRKSKFKTEDRAVKTDAFGGESTDDTR